MNNDHIKKAQSEQNARIAGLYLGDELQKGGEGSKGGKIIGHTKSGKPIYDKANHTSHSNFSKQDHKDAANTHDRFIVREENAKHHTKQFDAHVTAATGMKENSSSDENTNEHHIKVGDTVKHEGKEKKVAEVRGNDIAFHGEQDSAHASKVFSKEGGSLMKKSEQDAFGGEDVTDVFQKGEEMNLEKAQSIVNTVLEAEWERDELEKGGKAAVIGEKRTFRGREYIKTSDGWKFHGKGTGAKAQEHAKGTINGGKIETSNKKPNDLLSKEEHARFSHLLALKTSGVLNKVREQNEFKTLKVKYDAWKKAKDEKAEKKDDQKMGKPSSSKDNRLPKGFTEADAKANKEKIANLARAK